MTASKDKGTRWESAIVDYLRANGVPHAERRAPAGTGDQGDIAGLPGVVVEAKNEATPRLASWLDEAEKERANAGAEVGVVWHHRRGKAAAADGFITMAPATLIGLLRAAGYIAAAPNPHYDPTAVVRLAEMETPDAA